MKHFLNTILSLTKEIISDIVKKKGNKSDIRLAYFGYWTSHRNITKQDCFFRFVESLTNKSIAVSWYKPSLIITSLFDRHSVLKLLLRFSKTPSLFFSGENLNNQLHIPYKNYLNGLPNLALGFDYESPYAKRFPLWLTYIFTGDFVATASLEEVKTKLKEIESNSYLIKSRFTSMVANHDGFGSVSRSKVVQSLDSIDHVSCGGKLLHNDDTLKGKYKDSKKEYLKDFVFNVCLENTHSVGYVTEKIFESIEAGCIPIYWGDDNPEPNILNPKRIIFWQENSDNKNNLETIQRLYSNTQSRDKFFEEPLFIKGAEKAIFNYFLMLRNEISQLLNASTSRSK